MVSILLKKQVRTLLEQHGSDSAAFETEQILKWATGLDRLTLTPDSEIDGEKAKKAINAAKRRIKGEPLQYILGEWDFFGLTFRVGEGVLIPRPETELLVEKVLKEIKKDGTVIDLCSGSGCIPIAISKKSGASCYGIEISEKALEYFKENIELNKVRDNVTPLLGDVLAPSESLLDSLPEKCDIITANPPYLTAEDMRELQREVRHEPETALFGGTDGLDFYRVIFGKWKKRLAEKGEFIVETGDKQAETVRELMEKEGFSCEIIKDYNKIGRLVFGRLAG
ncbi:MAG: peptide chain release factor N(5)-glutamine methyltransferase [Ruminococcaceae bacterium]|nr:peptide chain release factor N(5)-glutamine methyltransferase [Oscillospiraceae bacterium]